MDSKWVSCFHGSHIIALQSVFPDLHLDPLGFQPDWSTPERGIASGDNASILRGLVEVSRAYGSASAAQGADVKELAASADAALSNRALADIPARGGNVFSDRPKLSPSILALLKCPERIPSQCIYAMHAGADMIHVDVAAGGGPTPVLVEDSENTSALFTPDLMRSLKEKAREENLQVPLDIHVMHMEPARALLKEWLDAGVDYLTIHWEAFADKRELADRLAFIKENGRVAGLVFRPDTDIEAIIAFLVEHPDLVGIISQAGVYPCKGGQVMEYGILKNLRRLRAARQEHGFSFEIMVDGGIEPEVSAYRCIEAGADILVAGSAFFGDGRRGFIDFRIALENLTNPAPVRILGVHDILTREVERLWQERKSPVRILFKGHLSAAQIVQKLSTDKRVVVLRDDTADSGVLKESADIVVDATGSEPKITYANQPLIALECTGCGHQWPAVRTNICPICGHDPVISIIGNVDFLGSIDTTDNTMWRYRRLLPVDPQYIIRAPVGNTPVVYMENLSRRLGVDIWIKLETDNPTGTFKDREASFVVSRSMEAGQDNIVLQSTGNTAMSVTHFASLAGISSWAFIPSSSAYKLFMPRRKSINRIIAVDGHPVDVKQAAEDFAARFNFPKVSPFYERCEANATQGYEVAEALLRGSLPAQERLKGGNFDFYVQTIAAGMGPIGYHIAMQRLAKWTDGRITVPRIVAVESSEFAPIQAAWDAGLKEVGEEVATPHFPDHPLFEPTLWTTNIRKYYPHLRTMLADTNGILTAATPDEVRAVLKEYDIINELKAQGCRLSDTEQASFVGLAGMVRLIKEGKILKGSRIMLMLTGKGTHDNFVMTNPDMVIKPKDELSDRIIFSLAVSKSPRPAESEIRASHSGLMGGDVVSYILTDANGEGRIMHLFSLPGGIKSSYHADLFLSQLFHLVTAFTKRTGRIPGHLAETGTGRGTIAIASALVCPEARVTGIDLLESYVKLARQNAIANGVGRRTTVYQGEILEPLSQKSGLYDVLMSTLPSTPMAKEEARDLDPFTWFEVSGGETGNEQIKDFILQAPRYLAPDGEIWFAISEFSGVNEVFGLMEKTGFSHDIFARLERDATLSTMTQRQKNSIEAKGFRFRDGKFFDVLLVRGTRNADINIPPCAVGTDRYKFPAELVVTSK